MNKKIFLLMSAFAVTASLQARPAAPKVDRIDPPYWWTGMADRTLQLQIQGPGIAGATLSVDAPGVRLDSVVSPGGPASGWQYAYLTVTPGCRPGKIRLVWERDGRRTVRNYELRARRHDGRGAAGFTSADVLYLVMPDRFADGDPSNNAGTGLRHPVGTDRSDPNARHGGDFAGLTRHLDYIDSLGVTAVWVNPVLENDMRGGSYHGYATTDYYRVDPRFGTNAEYVALVDSLHARGIKTVMDMIFNHVGSGHPWFSDPPAPDWFNLQDDWAQTNYRLSTLSDPYASVHDRRLTLDGWFVREMPDLNQRNPHLMRYLIQNSVWWIEETGIDGIRMDTYSYADREAMKRWIGAVKAEYPDFTIVGECWLGDTGSESRWQTGSSLGAAEGDTGLEVVMDFPLVIKSRDMAPFREETDAWHGLNTIYDHLGLDYMYADPSKVLRFFDNHDTERFIVSPVDSLGGWKQAMALLLTVPGIPQLYYGTELLMSGTREGGDGNVRRDMPGGFPGDTVSVFTREGMTPRQREAYDFIAGVNAWRRGNPAVAKGDMRHFLPDNGLYLYRRRDAESGRQFVVMMNGRDEPVTADMGRYAEVIIPGSRWRDILTGDILVPVPLSGTLTLAPRALRILEPLAPDM